MDGIDVFDRLVRDSFQIDEEFTPGYIKIDPYQRHCPNMDLLISLMLYMTQPYEFNVTSQVLKNRSVMTQALIFDVMDTQ